LQIYTTENQVLDKVKDLWKFFSKRFSESEKVFDKIAHAHTILEVILITKKIIEEEKMND
jgi:hypothetical protein